VRYATLFFRLKTDATPAMRIGIHNAPLCLFVFNLFGKQHAGMRHIVTKQHQSFALLCFLPSRSHKQAKPDLCSDHPCRSSPRSVPRGPVTPQLNLHHG
jgi:hypothetical protein